MITDNFGVPNFRLTIYNTEDFAILFLGGVICDGDRNGFKKLVHCGSVE
jgi:hypothetical protein